MPDQIEKVGFTFSEVVQILTSLFEVHPEKRDTFIARLQQLQKIGLPAGTNLGRGSRARYQNWQIADLMTFLDMLDCGVPPGFIAAHFANTSLFGMGGLGWNVQSCPPSDDGDGIVLLMEFNGLAYLRNPDRERAGPHFADHTIKIGRGADVLAELASKPAVAINLSRRLIQLQRIVEGLLPARASAVSFEAPRAKARS